MATNLSQSHYNFAPSLPAAIIWASLYSIAFAVTFFQWIKYRAWVWVVMVLAAGMESGGYIVRSISAQHVDNKKIYVVQFCLIVLAPVLMAAVLYVAFGRIVFHVVPRQARTIALLWVPPRFVTPIFVICDIIALFLQLIGAIIITSVQPGDEDAASKLNKGKAIALIGVAVQMISFGLFSVVAIRFNFTSKRFEAEFQERIRGSLDEKYSTFDGVDRKLKRNWVALLRCVNFASLMILVRSVYRMIDFALGRAGYTETHEWCVYIFDALPIFPVVALFTYWHPAKYLPYLGFRLPKHAR
ncbi:hypothetical protein OIDMADRAFT_133677 [Oidiodendron maius Zn]|uniref:RTA1 like protein n=1 Tax=Oidiodendron maius (strain Zn) TaxID=913774 RepID=A0A0C3GZF9_OIDMZ|nr:hypothetical protein OIDMADRAFT_133677 [Oidiodendron maius Zn]